MLYSLFFPARLQVLFGLNLSFGFYLAVFFHETRLAWFVIRLDSLLLGGELFGCLWGSIVLAVWTMEYLVFRVAVIFNGKDRCGE